MEVVDNVGEWLPDSIGDNLEHVAGVGLTKFLPRPEDDVWVARDGFKPIHHHKGPVLALPHAPVEGGGRLWIETLHEPVCLLVQRQAQNTS